MTNVADGTRGKAKNSITAEGCIMDSTLNSGRDVFVTKSARTRERERKKEKGRGKEKGRASELELERDSQMGD